MKQQKTGYAGSGHGTLKGYLTGFVLSIILTVIPFTLVTSDSISTNTILICIVTFAVIQILVHLYYFLHMNNNSDEVWNAVALIFTLLIIAIIVVGSLWIMYNLNVNMMPQ